MQARWDRDPAGFRTEHLPSLRREVPATRREVLGSDVGDHIAADGAASLVLDGLFTPRLVDGPAE